MPDSNFFIELDKKDGFYRPGQIVTGRVVRIVEGPGEEIGWYLPLKFQGLGVLYWEKGNQETYIDDTIQLNQQDAGDWTTLLPHGRNSFPFAYHLPVEIPASFSHTDSKVESRISYQALATYSPSIGPEVTALVDIPVERPLDLNLSPYTARPNSVEEEKYFSCCCRRSGPISFKLTFNKTGFLVGENIEFSAELVNNTSKNIKVIQVWISRTVIFRTTDDYAPNYFWEESIGPVFNLPALSAKRRIDVPVNFDMIPKDYRPINDFGCSFMTSYHQLNIKMIIPWAGDLEGSIPIVIGLLPFVPPCQSCTTIQSQSIALSLASSFVNPTS